MKKWSICIIAVAFVVLLVGLILVETFSCSFLSIGVHVFGKYAHVNMQQNCYFISEDEKGKEVTGQSTLTISGMVYPEKENKRNNQFTGHINIEDYPISLKDGFRGNTGWVESDFICITNQALAVLDDDYNRYYIIWILRSNPDVIVIDICQEDAVFTAVCAETEEEAIQNYDIFVQAFMERGK